MHIVYKLTLVLGLHDEMTKHFVVISCTPTPALLLRDHHQHKPTASHNHAKAEHFILGTTSAHSSSTLLSAQLFPQKSSSSSSLFRANALVGNCLQLCVASRVGCQTFWILRVLASLSLFPFQPHRTCSCYRAIQQNL